MSDHCGTTTEEGSDVCIPGECSCASENQNNASAPLSVSINKITDAPKKLITKVVNVVLSDVNKEKSHVEENS